MWGEGELKKTQLRPLFTTNTSTARRSRIYPSPRVFFGHCSYNKYHQGTATSPALGLAAFVSNDVRPNLSPTTSAHSLCSSLHSPSSSRQVTHHRAQRVLVSAEVLELEITSSFPVSTCCSFHTFVCDVQQSCTSASACLDTSQTNTSTTDAKGTYRQDTEMCRDAKTDLLVNSYSQWHRQGNNPRCQQVCVSAIIVYPPTSFAQAVS
jgi:hypothetical protein